MSSLAKQLIRKNILAIRNNLTQAERVAAEALIKTKLTKFLLTKRNEYSNLAVYYPIDSELNIIEIIKDLPFRLLLPVIQENSKILKFCPWKPESVLISSKFNKNILEPKTGKKEISPDIIIAPLIACDKKGNRLGSGKAMYDITIEYLRKQNPNILYIGICFDFQIIDKIPIEPHDQKLDIIFSETKEYHLVFP